MGDAKAVLVGRVKSMSNIPFILPKTHHKFGNLIMKDDLQSDALLDTFSNQSMGITAENVAKEYQVS